MALTDFDEAPGVLERALDEILPRVRILHSAAFTWDGATTRLAQDGDIVAALARKIYQFAYTQPTHVASGMVKVHDVLSKRRAIESFSRANASTRSYTDGWTVLAANKTHTKMRSPYGSEVIVPHSRVRKNGETFALLGSREDTKMQPDWYHAYGERGLPYGGPVVRVYWHLSPEGAAPLMRAVTSRLNDAGVGFQTKVLVDVQDYRRADGGVLYVCKDDWDAARPAIMDVHRDVEPYLRPSAPLFTLPLGRGIGMAEDPGVPGTSYGQHRSEIVAKGLVAAKKGRARTRKEQVAAIHEAFRAAGLDPDRAHVQPRTNEASDRRLLVQEAN